MTQTKLNYFLTIPAKDVGWPRPKSVRFSRFGSYNSKTVRKWMTKIKDVGVSEIASKGLTAKESTPVTIVATAYMPMPKATAKKRQEGLVGVPHIKKPDVDNLLKPIVDGLTEAGMWADDNQVWSMKIQKVYCKQGDQRVEVAILW
jgi:Holliday junction resolvase RusA-like endonuclease